MLAALVRHLLRILKVLQLLLQLLHLLLCGELAALVLRAVLRWGPARQLRLEGGDLLAIGLEGLLKFLLLLLLLVGLLLQVNNFFAKLHYLVAELFLLAVGVGVLLLLVKLLEEADLGLQLVDGAVPVLELVLERVDLLAVEVLKLVPELLELLAEDAVLLDLVLELLSGDLGAGVGSPGLFFPGTHLGLLQRCVELVVEQPELPPQRLILLLLPLDQPQPH